MSFHPNFMLSAEDHATVDAIIQRARTLIPKLFEVDTEMAVRMDIVACHNGCCPLDLQAFLTMADLDFAHDIAGIFRHFDRREGVLTDHFVPRCALPQKG